jgi:P27 family predicted phage terminase small subunit
VSNEIKLSTDLEDIPPWLSTDQRKLWQDSIKHCPPGLLKSLDGAVFAQWIIAQDTVRLATMELNKVGIILNEGENVKANPAFAVFAKASELQLRCASEMGFTPAARAKIDLGDAENKNKFGKFREPLKAV